MAALGLLSAPGAPFRPYQPTATDGGFPGGLTAVDDVRSLTAAAAQLLPDPPTELAHMFARLVLAALLGGAISYRGSRRRNEYQIVHTNMVIAFTGAMMMIIVGSDLARAFGLVGASSIVRYRTPINDPRALASLFVSMGAGIAVGVGLIELAILGTVMILLVELFLERFGGWMSNGWYRPERGFEVEVETDTPEETITALYRIFEENRVTHTLMDYERGKRSLNVRMGLAVGLPDHADADRLTLEMLAAGARSVRWRLSKE